MKSNKIKKGTGSKSQKAKMHVVCPECGYETCICKLEQRSKVKKARHKMLH